MTLDLNNVQSTEPVLPPRIILYGQPKIGKSTFAAQAPNPFFIDMNAGLGQITVPRAKVSNYKELIEALDALLKQEHKFQTVVLDSTSEMEKYVYEEVCALHNVKNIELIGYGKGYTFAYSLWIDLTRRLTELTKRGIAVILIAHDKITKSKDPTAEAFDMSTIFMREDVVKLLFGWADVILYAKEKVLTIEDGQGFNVTNKGKSAGRKLYTVGTPAFIAGNRYGLPPELPLSWNEFEKALTKTIKGE